MALPSVDQARLVAEELGRLLRTSSPNSVAIVGCAGGNGFEHIDPQVTRRVVGIDINSSYAAELMRRFAHVLPGLEVHVADVQDGKLRLRPVEFVYAALLLEYVRLEPTLAWIRSICAPGGTLATLIQLPSTTLAPVSPSPFVSVQRLAPVIRLVSPQALERVAGDLGFSLQQTHQVRSVAGKSFAVHVFRSSSFGASLVGS